MRAWPRPRTPSLCASEPEHGITEEGHVEQRGVAQRPAHISQRTQVIDQAYMSLRVYSSIPLKVALFDEKTIPLLSLPAP